MSELERSEIQWGRTEIAYSIRRSDRRGTVAIAIEPSGAVVLTAPRSTPVPRLDRVVREKAKWIVDRVRRRSTGAAPTEREFVSGETCLYLGRRYRLRLLRNADVAPIALRSGWLELPLPRGLDAEHHRAYARAALIDWYSRRAAERFPTWIVPWAKKLGVTADRVLVANQSKRWGSCGGGVLRFHWRLMQAPRAVVDYVIAHEVVHLRLENHDAEFWSNLGRLMPDYERRRDRLRELGPALDW